MIFANYMQIFIFEFVFNLFLQIFKWVTYNGISKNDKYYKAPNSKSM